MKCLAKGKRVFPSVSCAVAVLSAFVGCAELFGPAEVRIVAGDVQVVTAPDAPPSTRYAANELTNYLAQVLGAPVPLATAPDAGRTAIILGTNAWSAAAGLAPERLPRDAFQIRADAAARRVYVCGCDDPKFNLPDALRRGGGGYHERATVFGAYEFLHRHAGVRFYFPGELGTYVPRRAALHVPEGKVDVVPDFEYRDCYVGGAGLYPGVDENDQKAQRAARGRYSVMLRESTDKIPCCHGQNRFRIAERFSESHPEYFQKRKDGTRCVGTKFEHSWMGRQLCHTSPVWDVFKADTLARIRKGEKWVDVMPQDGMSPCWCETCQKTFNTTNFTLASGYATELIWGHTCEVADAITAAGLKGGVSQMAYGTYRDIPSMKIPENVAVVLATGGPWAESHPDIRDKQIDFIRSWAEKLGRPVAWIWTYPMKNYGRLQAPDVPQHAPRAYIEYYKRAAPYVKGSFVETNGDRIFYNYLNFYVWSRWAWNHGEDVETMLAEHHRLMFGAGAAEMTKFFDGLEKKWIGECAVPSLIGETEIGPWLTGPSEKTLWTKIWGRRQIEEFAGYLARAAAAVAPGSMEARRIAWIKAEFFDRMAARSADYFGASSPKVELDRRAAKKDLVNLIADRSKWTLTAAAAVDRSTHLTPEGAIRVTVKDRHSYVGYNMKNRLKPGATYRLSYFLKTENLEGRGACMEYEEYTPQYRAEHLPKNGGVTGTDDWMHLSFTFKAGPDCGTARDRSMLWLRVFKSTGTAWFDGMCLEEVK